jgi:hypothetical protein
MTTSNLATTCYLVLGCGESTIDAIRSADNDPENWTLARVLMHTSPTATWCVLVDGAVEENDLDADHATINYRTVLDFDLALGACAGVDPCDVTARNTAVDAMRDAGAIA